MSEILNATCAICNTKYHMCETCKSIKSFQPWRTVTDTLPHYTIYLTLAEYTKTGNKEKAKEELQKCDLTGLETFDKDIRKVIKEIIKEKSSEVEFGKTSTKSFQNKTKKTKNEAENNIE